MAKLTKIIATIGPVSDSEETIEAFIKAGVNVIRFNYKHSSTQWHRERIERVKKVAQKMNSPLGLLLDLQGPEIRMTMPFDQLELKSGENILLSESIFKTNKKGFSLTEPKIIDHLIHGQKILVDDGLFVFRIEKKDNEVYAVSETEGTLKSKKTVNIMDLDFDFPVLHERDMIGLRLAKETGINYIALSFVRNGEDLKILRKEMKKMDLNAKIVAKIETRKAINNIDEIIKETDVIMIARGDMGVEMPMEEVPYYQKLIIKKCMESGTPVITATQMLESMTQKHIPTRAETSDVANAIYDFTDATMLSGETASGKYPLEAVRMMAKIAEFTESKNRIIDIRDLYNFNLNDDSEMICDSAFNLHKVLESRNDDIKGFIVFTETGKTVRMLARYRPHVPIFAFCPNVDVAKSLAVTFGVIAIVQSSLKSDREIIKEDLIEATNYLYKNGLAQRQDRFIAMHGDYWSTEVGASTIKIIANCCS